MKKLLIGAFALTMTTGVAFAAGGTTSALDNKEMMGTFYTDADMGWRSSWKTAKR